MVHVADRYLYPVLRPSASLMILLNPRPSIVLLLYRRDFTWYQRARGIEGACDYPFALSLSLACMFSCPVFQPYGSRNGVHGQRASLISQSSIQAFSARSPPRMRVSPNCRRQAHLRSCRSYHIQRSAHPITDRPMKKLRCPSVKSTDGSRLDPCLETTLASPN